MIDYGSLSPKPGSTEQGMAALTGNNRGPFKMARTLSPNSANQVLDAGRKVMSAWLDGGAFGQANSLPRDLSLDAVTGELLQQFAPELAALRLGSGAPTGMRAAQVEVIATFTVSAAADPQAEFGVAVWQSEDGLDEQRVSVLLGQQLVGAAAAAGPLQPQIPAGTAGSVRLHIIADHSILSVIANNRTALTTFVAPRDENSTRIGVFGVDGTTVSVAWQAWALRSAVINNTIATAR
jgi:sucrose-6-phosphate hydrolase SacC (GH32 family)